ncbi:MAG: LysE family translocator [Rhodobacterales bacterium]|jgi:threonine/homoserine/homoserine lactone efflux protein|nr:LysE family translocator [Rhodobacterales bacterium]MDX5390870.1 LysE family translocator [Rhodobacterales bacterium]MDX5490565.1 LysE family translocator [Rhodobacterales bacterium]
MFAFVAAVFFLIITPGPGVLSTAGVGSGFGFKAGSRYVLGLFLGTNLVAIAVVSGLAALVLADPRIRTILFVLSFSYLAYLAFRIAFAGNRVAFIERARPPGVGGGLLLQIVNPKAYAVNTALFTGFAFLPDSYALEVAIKFVIMNAIWIPIHFLWLMAGVTLHRLDLSERSHSLINIGMALSMLAVVAIAVIAQLR